MSKPKYLPIIKKKKDTMKEPRMNEATKDVKFANILRIVGSSVVPDQIQQHQRRC